MYTMISTMKTSKKAVGYSLACRLEVGLLRNTNEVIIIVDIGRVQKKVRTKIVPVPCKGDLDFLQNCSVTDPTELG